MLLAQDAWSLQVLSKGRFELGLGTQVKGNVVRRYGMPWSAPAPRMRDYVGALRAIFECWQTGSKLDYRSDAYVIDRMQPFFSPGPIGYPEIPIALGAVGPHMTRVAGEVADIVIAHPTNSSPSYLADVMRPKLAEGAQRGDRDATGIRLIANPMIATGPDAASVAGERKAAREVLAFTYATPAYRASLDHHGWGHVHEELLRFSREGRWGEMAGLLSEEMLDVLVPSASWSGIAELLIERYAGVADGISLRLPKDASQDTAFLEVVEALQAA
jgi:probable F420-dependent oxidoreductase